MSSLVEVKTDELVGSALEYSVAVALGAYGQETGSSALSDSKHWVIPGFAPMRWDDWTPSVDWSQGGPLIEEHSVCLATVGGKWFAAFEPGQGLMEWNDSGSGDTALVAACRAIVHAKLGETVKIPVELIS